MTIYDFGIITAYDNNEVLEIKFPYNPDLVNLIKSSDKYRARWNKPKGCWQIDVKSSKCSSVHEVAQSLEDQLLSKSPEKWRVLCKALENLSCASERFGIKVGASGVRVTTPTGHQIQRSIKRLEGAVLDRGNWFLSPSVALNNLQDLQLIIGAVMGEDRATFLRLMDFLETRMIMGQTTLSKEALYAMATDDGVVFMDRSFILKADKNMHVIEMSIYPAVIKGYDVDEEGKGFAALDYCPPEQAYDLLCLRNAKQNVRCLNETHVADAWNRVRAR